MDKLACVCSLKYFFLENLYWVVVLNLTQKIINFGQDRPLDVYSNLKLKLVDVDDTGEEEEKKT